MKKLIFSIAFIVIALAAFSFKPIDKSQGVYDPVSGNILFNAGLAASFTSSYDNHSDKDVIWNKYHKVWTVTSAQATNDISNVLDKY